MMTQQFRSILAPIAEDTKENMPSETTAMPNEKSAPKNKKPPTPVDTKAALAAQQFKYYDFKKNPIPDPRPKIDELNLRFYGGKMPTDAEKKSVNYMAENKELNVGIAQLIGNKNFNEDRAGAGSVPMKFMELNNLSCQIMLRNFSNIMQEFLNIKQVETGKTPDGKVSAKSLSKLSGATFCIVIATNNRTYTINIGDCVASAILINKTTGAAKKHFALVENPHCLNAICSELPKTPNEVQVIDDPTDTTKKRKLHVMFYPAKDGEASCFRLTTGLNLFRALGDERHEKAGLTHNVDIFDDEFTNLDTYRIRLILGTDGASDGLSTPELWKNATSQSANKTCMEAASSVATTSYENFPFDNILTLVADIDPALIGANFYFATDGHRNHLVANAIEKMTYFMLRLCIDYAHEVEHKKRPADIQVLLFKAIIPMLLMQDFLIDALHSSDLKCFHTQIETTLLGEKSITDRYYETYALVGEIYEYAKKVSAAEKAANSAQFKPKGTLEWVRESISLLRNNIARYNPDETMQKMRCAVNQNSPPVLGTKLTAAAH